MNTQVIKTTATYLKSTIINRGENRIRDIISIIPVFFIHFMVMGVRIFKASYPPFILYICFKVNLMTRRFFLDI